MVINHSVSTKIEKQVSVNIKYLFPWHGRNSNAVNYAHILFGSIGSKKVLHPFFFFFFNPEQLSKSVQATLEKSEGQQLD